jgi:membrane-associated phospholipid phosphatase
MRPRISILSATLAVASGCHDGPTNASRAVTADAIPGATVQAAANQASSTSTVRWNRRAIALFRARGGDVGRINAYLSIAQYRAVLAAQDERHGQSRPSPAGAAAGASVVVLKQFYPLDASAIDAQLEAQRVESPLGTESNADFAAGETIGRAVAAAVLAWAAFDNFGQTPPGVPPVGQGFWVSSGASIVRGGLGARPFFLTSQSELRVPQPPAFGSAEYGAALAEVRAISDRRTAEQLEIARKWAPFAGPVWNGVATDLLDKYHRSELESARVLAYANAAEFDAIIACWDSKFTYWFIRPSQADPGITLPIGLPNHPSYPSGHSCADGAWRGVLTDAFPSERALIEKLEQEGGMSRVYAGIHYRFDIEAGHAIGRAAARLALARRGLE